MTEKAENQKQDLGTPAAGVAAGDTKPVIDTSQLDAVIEKALSGTKVLESKLAGADSFFTKKTEEVNVALSNLKRLTDEANSVLDRINARGDNDDGNSGDGKEFATLKQQLDNLTQLIVGDSLVKELKTKNLTDEQANKAAKYIREHKLSQEDAMKLATGAIDTTTVATIRDSILTTLNVKRDGNKVVVDSAVPDTTGNETAGNAVTPTMQGLRESYDFHSNQLKKR